jgi:hypothetical protein
MKALQLLLAAPVLVLAGCASTTARIDAPGNPMDAQASMDTAKPMDSGKPAAADSKAYLAVHDMPPARNEPLMSAADEAKIKKELMAARDRQDKSKKPGDSPQPTPAAKP